MGPTSSEGTTVPQERSLRQTLRLAQAERRMFHVKQRRMDYHLHTFHSMDGRQTVDDLCRTMLERGVEEICLTEHIEPGHPDRSLDIPPVWPIYMEEIRQAREKYPSLTIRAGVEIGDNPVLRDQIKADLDALPLDFRLLSLHLVNGVDPYESDEYFAGKTRNQAYREYAEAKAESILDWTDFDSVAHIGYAAKFSVFTGAVRALVYEDAPDVFDAILKHIIDLGKCLEVNTSGFASTGDTFAHSTIICRYIELGGENFTFGSDSHDVSRNYDGIERAKDMVRDLGGKYQASFDQRKMTLWRI